VDCRDLIRVSRAGDGLLKGQERLKSWDTWRPRRKNFEPDYQGESRRGSWAYEIHS
jgi:hypothetical protein